MKLKDIADMKEYLENRCYCAYEIYDTSGFFYNLFKPDTDCELLAEGERDPLCGTFVLARASDFSEKLQIVYIEHKDGVVADCVRFDATEHNKDQVLKFLAGSIEKMSLDEYPDTKTAESLQEIANIADAIITD